MDQVIEYNDIFKEDRGALNVGRMKMSNQGIIFKSIKTGKVEHLAKSDIEEIAWQRLPTNYSLRVVLTNGNLFRFMGFAESDYDKLKKFISNVFDLELHVKELCLKGWNWGTANFKGSLLSFDVDDKTAFEIPLDYVSHCTSAKNEVTLEFHQNDTAAVSLMELRFHLPTQSDGMDDRVTAFTEAVLSKANIIQATGDAIVTFSELQCLTPRGRYDIKIFPTFIQLHGKTFDYKIPLTTILRLFRLPHKDGRQVFFVLSLDPPIKQGQTRYHFLILLFNKDDEVTLELPMSEKELREKYEGKLQKTMSGSTFDVLGQIMKVLVGRKITSPASLGSSSHNPAITCSYRASAGLLYPLERGFIYIHKPPVHIRNDEILSINFARSGGSTRSFDFEVETNAGVVHTFSSIEKEEYSKLYDFVTKKNLRVKNRGTEPTKTTVADDDLVDSDEEEEPDAYLARVKHEGKVRTEDGGGGDDSDESDESFNPDAGSGSDGDVAEEFDSNASESSSDEGSSDGGGHKKEKKKEKKEKKEKEKKKEEREKPKSKPKEKKEAKPRKSKKDKDSDKPKRPMSAYFLWLNENREGLKKENPGLSLTELTKKAAEIWNTKIKDKSRWEKLAQEAKKKYEVDMAEYKASGGGADSTPSKKKKAGPSKSDGKKKVSSPIKSGSFKSKEYIDDSMSSSDDDKRPSKAPKKPQSDASVSGSGSDEDMKSDSNASDSD